MTDSDLTVSILREIRDGIHVLAERVDGLQAEQKATNQRLDGLQAEQKATNQRLDGLQARLDATNARLDTTNERLDVVNEHMEAIGRFAKNVARRHDRAIDELRERVAKLEARRKN